VIAFSLSVNATEAPFTLDNLTDTLPQGADMSLLVINTDSDSAPIYEYQSDLLHAPASTQKLLTALSARLILGETFRFATHVEQKGRDIIIRFSGDPTLTRHHLRALFNRLATDHKKIKGNIYLNGAAFDEFELADGLPWDNLGICYSAPSSAISLDENCVISKLVFKDDQQSQLGFEYSDRLPITIGENLTLLRKAVPSHCQFKLKANADNHYHLGGCIPVGHIPRYLKFAVQNTTAYTQAIIQQELQGAGIHFKGEIIRDDTMTGKVLFTHFSKPLPDLLDVMLKDSHNLIADNLLKAMGSKYFNEPGSFDNGVAAMRMVFKSVGIDLSRASLVDGSGLSRNNLISAKQLMAVVRYIFTHPELGLIQAMPTSGKTGTMKYRPSVRKPPLAGRVVAKTGTLFGTYNLAGQIETQSGAPLFFVQLVTGYYHPPHRKYAKKEIRRFEYKLYSHLYQNW
jgi:D-alanyl-D-alanine carboxypeptidase/D-alanyl-D-alanine-endopeptidase (penicillin-binding protein 4)